MSNPLQSLVVGLLGGLAFAALAACSPPFNHQAYEVESARATVMANGCLKKDGPLRWWRIEQRFKWEGNGEGIVLSGPDDEKETRRCLLDIYDQVRIPPFSGRTYDFQVLLREGDPGAAAMSGVPLAMPTHESLQVAFTPALDHARQCLSPASPPAVIRVIVSHYGFVDHVILEEGPAAESREGACIIKAFSDAAHVPEFILLAVTLHFTVRGGPATTNNP